MKTFISLKKLQLTQLLFTSFLAHSHGASFVTNGVGQGIFRTPAWTSSGTIQNFDQPYERLVGVTANFFAGAQVDNRITNNSNSNRIYRVSGQAEIEFRRNGVLMHTVPVNPTLSQFIPAGATSNILAADGENVSLALSLAEAGGSWQVRSSGGSGSNLKTNGTVTLTYTTESIGLISSDPIEALVNSTLEGFPNNRWLEIDDLAIANLTLGEEGNFKHIVIGGSSPVNIHIGGNSFENLMPGQVVNIPNGYSDVLIEKLGSSPQPFGLVFYENEVGLQITAVPEPVSSLLFIIGACFSSFSRRRVLSS